MGTQIVTIKDVAKAAGVSVATVSRAINNRSNVASEVRTHVLAIAKELRYVPHAGATSLSARRTNMVGLVLPDLHGEFFSELMRGVDLVIRRQKLHLLVASYHGGNADKREVLRSIRGRVDGVLILSPYDSHPEDFLELTDIGKPFVVLNSANVIPGTIQIGVDNYGGAVQMMEHLVMQGFKRIAYVSGPDDNSDSRERLRAYHDSMSTLLPDAERRVYRGNFDEASGYEAGIALISDNMHVSPDARIDAVFCANDMMALGVQCALNEHNINVPGEMAVAGFDDIPLARYMPVGLTSIRTDISKVGERAADIICHLIKGGEHLIANEILKPHLIARESTLRRRPL